MRFQLKIMQVHLILTHLTIGRNSQPIEGVAADLTVSVERAGLTSSIY